MKKVIVCVLLSSIFLLFWIQALPYSAMGAEKKKDADDPVLGAIEVAKILEEVDTLIFEGKYAEAKDALQEAAEKYDGDERIDYKLRELDKKHWQLTSQIMYDADGETISQIVKEYDADNRLIKSVTLGRGFYDDMQSIIEYEYDDFGNVISRVEYDKDYNIRRAEKSKYDENQKLIGKTIVDSDGTKTVQYSMEDNLEIVETTLIDKQGNTAATLEKNDENGNLIESYVVDSKGKLKLQKKKVYRNNSLEKELSYDEMGNEIVLFERIYDSDGNVTERNEYDENGELAELYTYSYGNNGLVSTEECIWYENGEIDLHILTSYSYDDVGNLIHEEHDYLDRIDFDFYKEYEYNTYSQLVSRTRKDVGGYSETEKWVYDANGILESESVVVENDPNNGSYSTYTVYDIFGHKLEESRISISGEFESTYTYNEYNRNGDLLSVVVYDEYDTLISSSIRRYDKNGCLIREDWTNHGEQGYNLYSNNENGRIAISSVYDAEGNLIRELHNEYRYVDF